MKTFKRLMALLLAMLMVLSMAACGKKAEPTPSDDSSHLDRADKELIAELIGGVNPSDLTDEELDALVNKLMGEKEDTSNIVNLSNTDTKNLLTIDNMANKDAYDENGAITKPFDQIYPELIEEEKVTFSGESILIKLASGKLTEGLKKAGIGALEEIVPLEGCAWYEAKLVAGADAMDALAAVRELKEVLLAEYNYEIQTAAIDDYKHFDKDKEEEFKKNGHNKDQWHFHHCGIVDGYEEMEKDGGDSSVIIAVIDTGVDYTHEDLKDSMWVNAGEIPDNNQDDDGNGYVDDYYGVDVISGKGNGGDTNGHGTHVAGIIAARNNNVGVMGIAYNTKIMSVKAAMHSGTLNQADIAEAVIYAYEMGAEVINMSFGGTACSIAVQDALAAAYTRCVLVASAGNSGYPNEPTDYYGALPNFPGALTYVLGVMSVDETGRESVFTNWDAYSFNGKEYELYAPGENIMSTLPGNQYGYLTGTSMAAPVVSAFAAILRGEFEDRDKYPTKFIYGQLASTSGNYADCCNPGKHTVGGKPHNLPQIANLNDALTKLPKPEVNVQDYYLFDDPKYSEKNNGDGVIDAGETIALGLVLRNRWGMSENTLVTIDTLSETSGMADPYFTILNPTVDYGSVGTYSTQDCGKVYTDELFTGWENPFLIHVSEDCPNDYRFTLNITVRCENALDEADTTTYVTKGKMGEYVRAGYILPSIIEEDMVLTKDNLYIIPTATVITAGTTVRVEPGTHIQFWSDDANDPYADSYIAYLLVNGKFLVEGTKEEPVYIYPSQLMDRYGVEIGSSNTGYVSLKYADVTNFVYYSTQNHTGTGNHIDLADHCTFRNNYSGRFCYRYLSGGVVRDNESTHGVIGHINARDCVFYKIAFEYDTQLYGNADRCIFNQCGIDLMGTYKNCVFLDNAMVDQTSPDTYYNSSLNVSEINLPDEEDIANDYFRVYYRPETGTTYVFWYNTTSTPASVYVAYLQEAFGGNYMKIETAGEQNWLRQNVSSPGLVGARWDTATECAVWYDGTPVDLELFPKMALPPESDAPIVWNPDLPGLEYDPDYPNYYFEIPGKVLPTDITFQEYAVDMDMDTTYQLAPMSTPMQLSVDSFLYESSDETVVAVSDTGLVTPVGKGSADVWVWSLDKALCNRVTFTVRDYVALEGIAFPKEDILVAVGDTLAAQALLSPANTTRKYVTYSSSDSAVATVDAAGNITGVSSGTAVITAACEGITATVSVRVYTKATSLTLSSLATAVSLTDDPVALPEVIASAGAEMELSWRSTDSSVVAVEAGKLIPKTAGTASVVVTDHRSGLSAACLVIVGENAAPAVKDVQVRDADHIVLLDNGALYFWADSGNTSPTLLATDVAMFHLSNGRCLVLFRDGRIQDFYNFNLSFPSSNLRSTLAISNVVELISYRSQNFFARTADGYVYAWGSNNTLGQLGIGTNTGTVTPTLVNLDGVVDVVADSQDTTWFLTEQGELYVTGKLDNCNVFNTAAVPTLIDTNVSEILYAGSSCAYLSTDGKLKTFNAHITTEEYYTCRVDVSQLDKVAFYTYDYRGIGIKDGSVYTFFYDSSKLTPVPGIRDAVDVVTYKGTHYIITESGLLFGMGENNPSYNHMAGNSGENPVTTPVMIPILPLAEETVQVTSSNLTDNVLTGDSLTLEWNKVLTNAAPRLYADGKQITVLQEITDFNRLTLRRAAGFAADVAYELIFDPGTLHAAGGVTNTEELRISFTWNDSAETPDDTSPDAPIVYEAVFDSTVQRIPTAESLIEKLDAWISKTQHNPRFTGNVILNPISTDFAVSHWLRPLAPTISAGAYKEIPFSGNYWGSVNETAIGLQMVDYTDFVTYARLMYKPYLTEAPENTFPFVTSVKLFNKNGDEVTTVGNETITFRVTFNRDMDTSRSLLVRFGSAFPYGDYEIEGKYVDARTWEGTYTLNTLIENGYQYFTISNGCSATDDLELQIDQQRFFFEIDTTAAQALIMQGTATDTGIQLKWTQDDFDTLMGYNVYRSTSEDGYYTRLNSTVIPAGTMEWFDTTVEPGVVYYYNFTVVKTDLTESEPSGKIVIMSKDTMAPNIYHSPAGSVFTGANMVISATITDNLNIAYANLYYRIAGESEWKIVRMNKLNDKYSAIIPAADVTTAGIEYYIQAFDGISYTYNASAEAPYLVSVQEAVGADALGDVDGDGVITNLDALLLLYTINDKYNMTAEEFARADLNGNGKLNAAEALQILRYVSGEIGSVKM